MSIDANMLGVIGKLDLSEKTPELWYRQKFVGASVRKLPDCPTSGVRVEMRYDDQCNNKHNTFSITGSTYDWESRGKREGWVESGGGCVHEAIAKAYPELAHLIKWHLVSDDAPMHYIANTLYLAGDRDYNGLRAGEEKPLVNGRTGETYKELVAANEDGVMEGSGAWDKYRGDRYVPLMTLVKDIRITPTTVIPNPPTLVWRTKMIRGEGKKRELEAARRTAIWPTATDEQLMQEPAALKAALEARHAPLMAQFFLEMTDAGFSLTPIIARAHGKI